MKKIKTKAFKDRLRGHKDGVITLFSPDGPDSGTLLSASKDGCIRAWNLLERKITTKLFVQRVNSDKIPELKENLDTTDILERGGVQQQQENQEEMGLEDEENEGNEEDNEDMGDENDQNNNNNEQDDDNQEEENQELDPEEEQIQKQLQLEKFLQYDRQQDQDQQFSCSTFSKNSIYAGFQDGNIFAWNNENGIITNVLTGHIDKVTSIQFLNQRQLVSTSLDHTVRIWDTMLGSCETIFKLPGPVSFLRVESQQIIDVIVDKNTFMRLNVDKNKIIQSIKFANTIITCFIVHGNLLIFGTIYNSMEIYDLENIDEEDIQPKKVIGDIDGWIFAMNILEPYLYTGGDDKKIRVWNLEKDLLNEEDLEGHQDGVISIEFAGGLLLTGSFDHSIRSWDLKEMYDRIRERRLMFSQDLWSKKHDAYHNKLHSKKKKKKKGKKGKKKK